MKFLAGYIRFADKLSQRTGSLVSWLALLLVLVTCYDVAARYIFSEGSVALQELEWHLFAVIFLIAAAFTLNSDEHVRVDVFYTRMTEIKKAWINFLGSVFFLIPFCILVILSSLNFVESSWLMKETSPDAGGLPARYIIKAVIPLSFLLLLVEGISLAFRSFIIIMNSIYQKRQQS